MTTQALRYHLPKKAIKADCPDCSPKHRKTLSRYVDSRTGEPLPEIYGRCDRESNCGYLLSPYDKGVSGLSYADQVYQQWKSDHPLPAPIPKKRPGPSLAQPPQAEALSGYSDNEEPVYCLPEEVFSASLGQYERNEFARLLQTHFGMGVADELLARFEIGTSAYWPGACVFWLKDEQNRVRGGQVVLFDKTCHTLTERQADGTKKRYTSWVHTALASRYDQRHQPRPAWLIDYIEKGEKAPVPFGLSQLLTAPVDQPVAIVEAAKTAVLCTPYFPQYVWLAVGALSYLNEYRLSSLRQRPLMLFPDLSKDGTAYARWHQTSQQLRQRGFKVEVSNLLEDNATDAERDGDGLADFLLRQWKGYPPDWD